MSRRKGEFEHRTSIFEGAYRAWSHLGGCNAKVIQSGSLTAAELDPLQNPHDPREDKRVPKGKGDECPQDSLVSHTLIYPYEPLPRSGLGHPFVQAIITPWLGPDADEADIAPGLDTLRTWWQHRRKGETPSAKSALNTPKMRNVVDGYTRHFFNVAYCLVVNDNEQPPRTLCVQLDIAQKNNVSAGKMKRESKALASAIHAMAKSDVSTHSLTATAITSNHDELDLVPEMGSTQEIINDNDNNNSLNEKDGLELEHKCDNKSKVTNPIKDPGRFPVIQRTFSIARSISGKSKINVDFCIAAQIVGVKCAHCVTIIEAALTGSFDSLLSMPPPTEKSTSSSSPIPGLLDILVDQKSSIAIIKISNLASAKRIVIEVSVLLRLIGYDLARVHDVSLLNLFKAMNSKLLDNDNNSRNKKREKYELKDVFDLYISALKGDESNHNIDGNNIVLDWCATCTCHSNDALHPKCQRHSQLDFTVLGDAFRKTGLRAFELVLSGEIEAAGCHSAMNAEVHNNSNVLGPSNHGKRKRDDLYSNGTHATLQSTLETFSQKESCESSKSLQQKQDKATRQVSFFQAIDHTSSAIPTPAGTPKTFVKANQHQSNQTYVNAPQLLPHHSAILQEPPPTEMMMRSSYPTLMSQNVFPVFPNHQQDNRVQSISATILNQKLNPQLSQLQQHLGGGSYLMR